MKKKYTVGNLKRLLKEMNQSPEDFTQGLPISNMTVRRWLKKEDSFVLPEKYHIHFFQVEMTEMFEAQNFSSMEEQLLKDGKKELNNKNFIESIQNKLQTLNGQGPLLGQVNTLIKFVSSNKQIKIRLVALGALAYFLNPFDLIPDALGPTGYLDDIGVMTFAISQINRLMK